MLADTVSCLAHLLNFLAHSLLFVGVISIASSSNPGSRVTIFLLIGCLLSGCNHEAPLPSYVPSGRAPGRPFDIVYKVLPCVSRPDRPCFWSPVVSCSISRANHTRGGLPSAVISLKLRNTTAVKLRAQSNFPFHNRLGLLFTGYTQTEESV